MHIDKYYYVIRSQVVLHSFPVNESFVCATVGVFHVPVRTQTHVDEGLR